jgi:hypothetical protein
VLIPQLAQLGVTAIGRLDFEQLVDTQRNVLRVMRDALKFDPRDPDNAARAMREWEVRDRLMGVTPSARTSIFMDAVRDSASQRRWRSRRKTLTRWAARCGCSTARDHKQPSAAFSKPTLARCAW